MLLDYGEIVVHVQHEEERPSTPSSASGATARVIPLTLT